MAAEGEGIEIKASEDVGITHMEKSDNLPDFDGPSASVEAPDPDKYQEGIAAATLPTAPAPLVQKTSLKKKGIYIEASATAAGPVLPPPESESLSSYDAMMQVRELKTKNQHLHETLTAKNRELESLRDLAEAAAGLKAQDVQENRVIELSKKNRHLHLLLEKERASAAALQAEVQHLGLAAKTSKLDPQGAEAAYSKAADEANEAAQKAKDEAKAWKDKYDQCFTKVLHYESKMGALKMERDKVAKALQREVGEDVPLTKVLEEGTDWRGRAQQLALLKDRVRELKEVQGLPSMASGEARYDSLHRGHIEGLRLERERELAKLREDCDTARAERDATRSKLDKAISRKVAVEAELKGLKEKLAVLLRKTENDDRLIAALQADRAAAARGQPPAVAGGALPPVAAAQLERMKQLCAEQEAQLSRQERIILALQSQAVAFEAPLEVPQEYPEAQDFGVTAGLEAQYTPEAQYTAEQGFEAQGLDARGSEAQGFDNRGFQDQGLGEGEGYDAQPSRDDHPEELRYEGSGAQGAGADYSEAQYSETQYTQAQDSQGQDSEVQDSGAQGFSAQSFEVEQESEADGMGPESLRAEEQEAEQSRAEDWAGVEKSGAEGTTADGPELQEAQELNSEVQE